MAETLQAMTPDEFKDWIRDGWRSVPKTREYRCRLVERDPPPRREGITYEVRVMATGRRELRRMWRTGPLRLIGIAAGAGGGT